MLSKKYRLPLKKTVRLQKSSHSPLFALRYDNNDLSVSRFGFIVSKRVDKSAVVRNRIKRLYSTSIQQLQNTIRTGLDILIIVRSGSKTVPGEKIHSSLAEKLRENKLTT